MTTTCPICSASLPLLQRPGACSCLACGGALRVQDRVPVTAIIVLWIVADILLSLLMAGSGLWWLHIGISGLIGAAIWFVCSRATRVVLTQTSAP